MSANAVMVTAGYYALKFLQEYQAVEKAAAYADRLTQALNDLFATRKDLPFFANNIQSIIHVETSCYNGISVVENPAARFPEVVERYTVLQTYALALMTRVSCRSATVFYCCLQHSETSMQKTLNAWDRSSCR
jgi:glutamate-1-semialdehyde 2,1-aminomutase